MRSLKTLLATVAMTTCLALGSIASAQIFLYDNGTPATGADGFGDRADTGGAFTMFGTVFNAPTTGTAYSINFGGLYLTTGSRTTDDFTVSVYAVSGGAPTGLPIYSAGLTDVTYNDLGLGAGTHDVYAISGVLSTPLTLTSGITYYLGISDTSSPFSDFATAETIAPGALSTGYQLHSGTFESAPYAMAFQLVVPEPSEWALLLVSGLGLIVARKFRTKLFSR